MSEKNPVMISQSPLIQFGPGMLKRIGRQAKFMKARKALVVSDPGVRDLGILEKVVERLKHSEVEAEIFCDLQFNPTEADVAAGTQVYKEKGCDLVVAVGGGSPMDAGKAIRLLAHCGGSPEEYDVMAGGISRIPSDLPPMIAVPTTAGTGSEVTNVAVVTLTEKKEKISMIGALMVPTLALVDPELSYGLPANLTAATGMDALVHCLESYCVKSYCPPADQAALGGMELVAKSLVRAVKDGSDTDARIDMAMAATLGGLCFPQKGAGASHALSHPLSAVCGVHHGLANAIMVPHTMEINLAAVSEKMERIASCFDPDKGRGEDAPAMVRALTQEIGLPQRLSEVGVTEDQFDLMAESAFKDVSLVGNPVKLSVEELRAVYERAY